MGAKQYVRALLLLRLFELCVFYNHRTPQKIYLYHHSNNHHHHPNDHSHHHVIIPLSIHSFVINQSETNSKKEESSFTDLSHISWVLKWSGTYIRVHGFLRTMELHIPSVLYSSRTIHKNPGFHSTAVSHAACGPRASFIGWKRKQLQMQFYLISLGYARVTFYGPSLP